MLSSTWSLCNSALDTMGQTPTTSQQSPARQFMPVLPGNQEGQTITLPDESEPNTGHHSCTFETGNISHADTMLPSTWSMCNSTLDTMDQTPTTSQETESPAKQFMPVHVLPGNQEEQTITLPVPTPNTLFYLRGLCRPELQQYLQAVIAACDQRASREHQHSTYTMNQYNRSPEPCPLEHSTPAPLPSLKMRNPDLTVPGLRRSPRKKLVLNTGEKSTSSSTSVSEITPEKTQDSQMSILLEDRDICVSKDGLRKSVLASKKSKRPGYTLCYKLLGEIFSTKTMAESRGQGLTTCSKANEGKPILDRQKVTALKDYVVIWCKKNAEEVPSEQTLNDAITERISYARKQLKTAAMKSDK